MKNLFYTAIPRTINRTHDTFIMMRILKTFLRTWRAVAALSLKMQTFLGKDGCFYNFADISSYYQASNCEFDVDSPLFTCEHEHYEMIIRRLTRFIDSRNFYNSSRS